MAKYKITQIISSNGETKRQKDTLRCLGLRRMHQTVEVEKTPVTTGQVTKIAHLCKVEVID